MAFGSIIKNSAILLFATAVPALATLIIAYHFRVGEDDNAVYISVSLGVVLFIASIASTIVQLLYGIAFPI